MMRCVAWAVLAAMLAGGSWGCVAQGEYDELLTTYRKTQEQVVELRAALEEADARIAALEGRGTINRSMQNELEAALAERDRLRNALADAEGQLRDLGRAQPGVVVLDPETDTQLKDLAAANPQLMTYDPALGMIKLRSDLTFALGSAEVNAQASGSLGQLADVVTTGAAAQYALRIVGHTDNVPIKNPATKAKHPTNWHLSVHRAIAVRDVLGSAGVAPSRTYVAGYGEYRPVVANPARGGAEANRRVEIFLKPMSAEVATPGVEPAAATPGPAPDDAPAETVVPASAQPTQPEFFK